MAGDEDLFRYHQLNGAGQDKVAKITNSFAEFLERLKLVCPQQTREFSLVKTKLEEACFFAKKSVATHPENQG